MTSMLLIERPPAPAVSVAVIGEGMAQSTFGIALASFIERERRHTRRRLRSMLSLLAAVAKGDFLFSGIFAGSFLGHLSHHVAVPRHERRDLLEAGAVPALEFHHPGAFVVRAARLD